MRRDIFFIVTIPLTVVIGALVLSIHHKIGEQSVDAQTNESTNVNKVAKVNSDIQENLDDDDQNYEEKVAFDVLKPTIRKWLRGQKIKSEFTSASDESIKEIAGVNKSELSLDIAAWFSSFSYQPYLIDVDGDGMKELAFRNQCAPVGNCQLWIFKKYGRSYRILLETDGGAVQQFRLLPKRTNGVFDLETKDHADAWSGGIAVYEYDGKKYKIHTCSTYNYSYLNNGRLVELKKPIIKSVPCYEE